MFAESIKQLKKRREVSKLLTTRVTLTTSDWAVLILTVTPKINTSLREMHQQGAAQTRDEQTDKKKRHHQKLSVPGSNPESKLLLSVSLEKVMVIFLVSLVTFPRKIKRQSCFSGNIPTLGRLV